MSEDQSHSGFRPLYAKARETLLDRIRTGEWRPGQVIPNEFEIAAQLGVSQGTARKAIDALAADGLLVRIQGRGTYVVEHTPADVLFRFFHLYDAAGRQIHPDSTGSRSSLRAATQAEATALALTPGADVVVIDRLRTREGRAFIAERIVLPAALFPGLVDLQPIPNTLYDLFQKAYGVLVSRADERVSAVNASAGDAEALGVPAGTALLRIDRTAFDLDSRPVEWRVGVCHLEGAHYGARLK